MDACESILTAAARAALRRVRPHLRDDARGEALLAAVEGRDQVAAIDAYRKRESRRSTRETNFTDLGVRHGDRLAVSDA